MKSLLKISVLCLALGLAANVQGQCDLQMLSAGPCLADGTYGTPKVGEIYGLKLVLKVVGTPSQPFRIKWTIANVTYYYDNISITGPGEGWWWDFLWWVNLDDAVPWSITLDPDNTSGDTNIANNTITGTLTPIPPTNSVELYSSRIMYGWEHSTISFQPGSGTIGNIWVLYGKPTTHGAQSVINVTAPANSRLLTPAPYGVPIYEIARSNIPAATFRDTNQFVVKLSNIRVNPALMRTATWSDVDNLSTNWTQWLAPDPMVQCTNIQIAAFVQQSLPANYRSALTPYDAARTLHRAVMKKLTYQSPPPHGDAVNVLQDGTADCGGFAALLTAALRYVGIPARRIEGFWQGTSSWHVRVELHLPVAGCEWFVADPTLGNGNDPSGTYAYEFGNIPDGNNYLAMDVGDLHQMPYANISGIQVANWWWYGGATFNSYDCQAYLQPLSSLCVSNITSTQFRCYIPDVPTQGSVVIETSTNFAAWTPIATNTATGNRLDYLFPVTSPKAYFRAILQP